ncbi:hypothetical protein [Plantactinospora sonchi]|uniref:Uncharacterized protein n=1 Tax=Plantactinospora sonchi TaxID=1544735 RepID=A0ABU7RZ80_9ACTN
MSRQSTEVADPGRTEDLLTLARLSLRPDAVRTILDWLGQRTRGTVLR